MGFQNYIMHIMYDLLGKHSIRHQFAHFCRMFRSVELPAFSVDGMWHHLSEKIGSMGCQWSCHDSCEGHLHVGHGVLTIWLIDH